MEHQHEGLEEQDDQHRGVSTSTMAEQFDGHEEEAHEPAPKPDLYNATVKDDKHVICLECADTAEGADPKEIGEYRCNCRYLWLRELHALTALMMSNTLSTKVLWLVVIVACGCGSIANTTYIMEKYSDHQTSTLITIRPVKKLRFPTLVFCPKNPDGFNYTALLDDIYSNVGYLEESTALDLIQYFIAGSGFDNVDLENYSQTYLGFLDDLYNKWRGTRSVVELFRFAYDDNGIKCSEMFNSCFAGSQTLDCCDIFEPTYVMMRGRCFRLVDPYYQQDVDETDKLSLFFNGQKSPLLAGDKQTQVVMYISDGYPEIGLSPRYYLNVNDWNRLRIVQKKISMLSQNNKCSTLPEDQGKSSCFVRNWIQNVIVSRLNCSLPYYYDMLPYLDDITVCEPSVVTAHYAQIMTTRIENYHCIPACNRIENTIQLTTSIDYSANPKYAFRIEASFNNLEFEQYDEVQSTSLAGFISELGGQSGLFVGISIITLVQLLQSITVIIYRKMEEFYRRYVAVPLSLLFRDDTPKMVVRELTENNAASTRWTRNVATTPDIPKMVI